MVIQTVDMVIQAKILLRHDVEFKVQGMNKIQLEPRLDSKTRQVIIYLKISR